MNRIQGGNDIFDQQSNRVITRQKTIEIPISKEIIKHLKKMAARDKVTSVRLKNISGVIYDNDWITGVEYEN